MKTPRYLKKGDSIGVVSTARKISHKDLQDSIEFIESWGLKIILGKSIGAQDNQFAGNDILRTSDFQQMLDDPNIKAIWCAKGGYGTVRIIDQLDFSKFAENPKWIIGYSDITVLHSHIHNLGVETLHAQILLGVENKTKETWQSIRTVLFGENHSISIEPQICKTSTQLKSESLSSKNIFARLGRCSGQLVGGNLSILYSLCGSPSAVNTDGKILFIEDLDEYLYHIDRMMMNLKRNGLFKNLSGLIVGGMTEMNDNIIPFGKTAEEIIWDTIKEHDYPVCFGFPAGHIDDNRALVMGREVKMTITEKESRLDF